LDKHPADRHLLVLWRLTCEYVAAETDRITLSEPLKHSILVVMREVWDKSREKFHEDETRRIELPTSRSQVAVRAQPRDDEITRRIGEPLRRYRVGRVGGAKTV